MKTSTSWPPNIKEIRKHFTLPEPGSKSHVYFTYGDTLYNPSNIKITEDYMVHEETHVGQQEREGGPEKWWARYFVDVDFRINQESEAYGRQLHWIRKNRGSGAAAKSANDFAKYLSGPIYGEAITFKAAKMAISQNSI